MKALCSSVCSWWFWQYERFDNVNQILRNIINTPGALNAPYKSNTTPHTWHTCHTLHTCHDTAQVTENKSASICPKTWNIKNNKDLFPLRTSLSNRFCKHQNIDTKKDTITQVMVLNKFSKSIYLFFLHLKTNREWLLYRTTGMYQNHKRIICLLFFVLFWFELRKSK